MGLAFASALFRVGLKGNQEENHYFGGSPKKHSDSVIVTYSAVEAPLKLKS